MVLYWYYGVLFNAGDDIEPTVSVRCLGIKGIIPAYLANKKTIQNGALSWMAKRSLQSPKILVREIKYLILNNVLISADQDKKQTGIKRDYRKKLSPIDTSKSALACNVWDKRIFMSSRQWKPVVRQDQLKQQSENR